MRYAIIAAGDGSRLAAEGVERPKPLVEIDREPLVDRLIRVFMQNDADEIVVICNDKTTEVSRHLLHLQQDGLHGRRLPLRFLVKSTPSSMHSLFEISRYLEGAPFCLTTVDTIFKEKEFAEYIKALNDAIAGGKADGLMATTDFIDDEKPLYIKTDGEGRITAFLDSNDDCQLISGGIYGLHPKAIDTLRKCVERGESRMRNFQRALVADGLRLDAFKFSKILDIDHASDIEKAESFVREEREAVTTPLKEIFTR